MNDDKTVRVLSYIIVSVIGIATLLTLIFIYSIVLKLVS